MVMVSVHKTAHGQLRHSQRRAGRHHQDRGKAHAAAEPPTRCPTCVPSTPSPYVIEEQVLRLMPRTVGRRRASCFDDAYVLSKKIYEINETVVGALTANWPPPQHTWIACATSPWGCESGPCYCCLGGRHVLLTPAR